MAPNSADFLHTPWRRQGAPTAERSTSNDTDSVEHELPYRSSFLVTFLINFCYKAYSLAHMRTPTSVPLSVGEGNFLH